MSATVEDQRLMTDEASKTEIFALRFAIIGTPTKPAGSYSIGSDDTGTWVKDTEDNDT